jgi:hypothetical protein
MKTHRIDVDLSLCFDEEGRPRTKTSSPMTADEIDGKVGDWLRRNSDGPSDPGAYYFVDRWYQEFALPERSRPDYESAHPAASTGHGLPRRQMAPPEGFTPIYAARASACCRAKQLFVRMGGGYVYQDCVNCRKFRTVVFNELPDLKCDSCGTKMESTYGERGNYAYFCSSCKTSVKFADLLPHWSQC